MSSSNIFNSIGAITVGVTLGSVMNASNYEVGFLSMGFYLLSVKVS